jgi:hypothetical protein
MTDPETRRPGEALFALALVVFSVAAFWQSMRISGVEGPSEPGVFPALASATMIVASLAVLRHAVVAKAGPAESGVRARLAAIVPLRFAVLTALVGAYILAMPALGFMVSSALFLFATLWLLWRRGPVRAALVTVVSLAAIWLVFRELFQVVLPRGSLLTGLW